MANTFFDDQQLNTGPFPVQRGGTENIITVIDSKVLFLSVRSQ